MRRLNGAQDLSLPLTILAMALSCFVVLSVILVVFLATKAGDVMIGTPHDTTIKETVAERRELSAIRGLSSTTGSLPQSDVKVSKD